MIVAKLSRAGVDDQVFDLEPGQHRLGSDFGCEIVLIHPAVASEHLTLKVEEGHVAILPSRGAAVMVFRQASQQVVTLESGEWAPFHLGDRLIIADISLEIEGIEPESEAPNGLSERPVLRAVVTAILLIAVTGLNMSFSRGPESLAAALAVPRLSASDSGQPGVEEVVPQPEPDAALIRRTLAGLGVKVESLTFKDGRWQTILRVGDAAARAHVLARLAELGLPVSADIYADREIAEAVTLIAVNLNSGAQVLGLRNGVVTLSAIHDEALREKLVKTLKSDVPGLADVRFQDPSPVDLTALGKRITGVWHGAYPYVVLDDGAIVRLGETLERDVKLLAIAEGHLLVEVKGEQKKVLVDENAGSRVHQR
ncbi:hypothetical protein NYR54_06195 [Chelativorans sp. SCAU2101]|jgi:hypothetical protein|uniref:Uncharacterized protein n=1 Tax=Chelativorans petroleitrophicus TaxID=2975484 RepID=A0A9X3AZJ7_9HYPH|nr:hypothetical protein [Chelativorans petroleitrophicus]MCT8989884.1 hypothetical protein [Chelativorans petroleitrophicus]